MTVALRPWTEPDAGQHRRQRHTAHHMIRLNQAVLHKEDLRAVKQSTRTNNSSMIYSLLVRIKPEKVLLHH